MLYIENLCCFVAQLSLSGSGGVYIPQNSSYVNTSTLVHEIGITAASPVYTTKALSPAVFIADHLPGKIGKLSAKAFGSSYYDQNLSNYTGLDYQRFDLRESIIKTEGINTEQNSTKPITSPIGG